MSLTKKRILRFLLILILAGAVMFALLPFGVANGLRLWIQWKARQQKLNCTIEKIEAPLLRPVVIHNFHLVSATNDSPCRIDLGGSRATLELNLRAIILRLRDPGVRSLTIEDLRADIHRNSPGNALSESGWEGLQKMLPGNLALERGNLRIENGSSLFVLGNLWLRASQIEAGPFSAGEFRIESPLFRRTFTDLRGSTHWQGNHLTIAGVRLAPGLDMESITADLSQLGAQHIGCEFDLDTFGGKMRGNLAADWVAQTANWTATGSATDVSLAQTAQSFGFTDRVDGVVHACKFTFRGDPHDPSHTTASLWTELTRLSWRNRAADVIMLGAALYNRQIQIQQLYVKQRENQLTLNGELALPNKAEDWLNPDFRGTISAGIANLGDFAKLFGANPGDFAGQVAVEGTMSAGGRKIGGHLNATGKSLSIFKSPVDTFSAKLTLKANDLEIEQLEVQRQADMLQAQGKIDLGPDHGYSGTSHFTLANVAQYLKLFPFSWTAALTGGAVTGDWSGNGNAKGHAGKFHLTGHALQTIWPTKLLPFNAEIDADYSPGSIFFRQAHLTNEHASVNGFFTVAAKYLQLQAVALDLNGKPKLRGNAFLPIALPKLLSGSRFIDAVDVGQKMDADLAIEAMDLAEFSEALTGQRKLSGNLAARLSIFGALDGLQGWWETHLHDYSMADDPARITTDQEWKFNSGSIQASGTMLFAGSDPVTLDATIPIRLGEQHAKAWTEPFSATLGFPKLSLARVPRWWSRDWLRDGLLAGRLVFSETLAHPKISGNIQLTNGIPGNIPIKASDIAAKISFAESTATIEALDLVDKGAQLPLRGSVDFADLSSVKFKLTGARGLFDLTPAEDDGCIEQIALATVAAGQPAARPVTEIDATSNFNQPDFSLSLLYPAAAPDGSGLASANARALKFCATGDAKKTLIIGSEAAPAAEKTKPKKKSRKR